MNASKSTSRKTQNDGRTTGTIRRDAKSRVSTTTPVGQLERRTQDRVVRLFCQQLGYEYLGNWIDRLGNRNVEAARLRAWLEKRGVGEPLIHRALHELERAAALGEGRSLYEANREVYGLLRYGVKIKLAAGEQTQTVWLIDWDEPGRNDFAIAEEVTVQGESRKRPDIVLYVNGIALAVLELKRSTVSVSEGIRQNLGNQQKPFIRDFFTTVQLILAGNDTEGLRYGVIETPEKYYRQWKEENADWSPGAAVEKYLPPSRCPGGETMLDCALLRMFDRPRLLELVHDFVAFDSGVKKIARPNQYFAVRAAQAAVQRRAGGIIWHTQGSGKSLTMVWLAKWIREHVSNSRVLVITDRMELDEQIEGVFRGVDEEIYRTRSGADLLGTLNRADEWLVCSLVHKFGRSEEAAVDEYIADLQRNLPPDFRPKGELFVFVDECHRTQSGKLHRAMKSILPDAVMIGFTGTPLLKADKQKSVEVFGPYIHTYKYDEARRDGVVLDLRYEARDIEQRLTSPERVDQWFEAKTRGLTEYARARIKQRWGQMQEVLSAQSRLEKIVADVLLDMETRLRLMDGRGNALLVCSSIYQACKFYELFSRTPLKGKCAIVTSYRPDPASIAGEESGEGLTERLRQYEIYRRMLADHFDQPEDEAVTRTDEFEQEVKRRFVKEPGRMKLLIVVDKLLTGFDAPPATYLYIDKPMRDHGLFQAICRVNRLDTEDKEYGYIVDYKDLFQSLQVAVQDYTSGAFDGYDPDDVAGVLENRLEKARERLEETLEQVRALCEPVAPPRDSAAYLHYFVAEDTQDKEALKKTEQRRMALYKAVSALLRAYASLVNEISEAGYSADEAEAVKREVVHYEHVRQEARLASGDYVDLKMFEPAMRHLLDTYIQADESRVVGKFDETGLIELFTSGGLAALRPALPEALAADPGAMTEAIENNVRRLIIDEQPVNPKYYERMSRLLDDLIGQRKAQALEYQEYLRRLQELARQVQNPAQARAYPPELSTSARRALYDNLDENLPLALRMDEAIRRVKKDSWRGNLIKEREVLYAIHRALGEPDDDAAQARRILDIVREQDDY